MNLAYECPRIRELKTMPVAAIISELFLERDVPLPLLFYNCWANATWSQDLIYLQAGPDKQCQAGVSLGKVFLNLFHMVSFFVAKIRRFGPVPDPSALPGPFSFTTPRLI